MAKQGTPGQIRMVTCTSFLIDKETVLMLNGIESESLVKINVYYTSMNEKTIEDKIVYSIEVN